MASIAVERPSDYVSNRSGNETRPRNEAKHMLNAEVADFGNAFIRILSLFESLPRGSELSGLIAGTYQLNLQNYKRHGPVLTLHGPNFFEDTIFLTGLRDFGPLRNHLALQQQDLVVKSGNTSFYNFKLDTIDNPDEQVYSLTFKKF